MSVTSSLGMTKGHVSLSNALGLNKSMVLLPAYHRCVVLKICHPTLGGFCHLNFFWSHCWI